MPTVGIHLIWTTYGTWLPGDERGHWSPLFDLYGGVLERGGKLQLPDEDSRNRSKSLMTEGPFVMNDADMQIVANEMSRHVFDGSTLCRKPTAFAAAIEPTHVHLLVGSVEEDIEKFAGRLKGRTSSEILATGRHPERKHVWTAGYWRVFLFDEIAMEAVRDYIDRHHVRAGRPANPYSWCRPN
jgi:REP element-mobilizing transposase RayT